MALPTAVAQQIVALNAAIAKVVADRDRINNLFEDGLGASTWSLLSAVNQQAAKNAIVSDMQASVTNMNAVITALQAM